MTRLFRYILVSDTGMAPCTDHCLVTLATCKPDIRRNAQLGDLGRRISPDAAPTRSPRLCWTCRQNLEVGTYERTHRGRSDAVYRDSVDGTFERVRPDYHAQPDEIRKDLSASVLIFDKAATWYFGDRPRALPENLSHLAAAGRGYRVNGPSAKDIVA